VGGPFGVRDPQIADHALPQALARIERYDAVQDNPWPILFRELDEHVPGSRFVLTVRPTDDWLRSVRDHFGGRSSPMRTWIYGEGDPAGHEVRYRERYERHNADVRAWFADRPGDLLELDLSAGQGWPELGAFLGRPVPEGAFPHANATGPMTTVLHRVREGAGRLIGR